MFGLAQWGTDFALTAFILHNHFKMSLIDTLLTLGGRVHLSEKAPEPSNYYVTILF